VPLFHGAGVSRQRAGLDAPDASLLLSSESDTQSGGDFRVPAGMRRRGEPRSRLPRLGGDVTDSRNATMIGRAFLEALDQVGAEHVERLSPFARAELLRERGRAGDQPPPTRI
jgi:hypothetical protein